MFINTQPKFQDLFIRDEALGILLSYYEALLRVVVRVEEAADVAATAFNRRVSGGQRPKELKDTRLFLERERVLEAAKAGLAFEAKKLAALIRPVRAASAALREFEAQTRFPLNTAKLPESTKRDHLRMNILTAEALCDAAKFLWERYAQIGGSAATEELFLGSSPDAREWVVQISGHGSVYLFEGTNDPHKVPDGPYLTESEANEQAIRGELNFECCGAMYRIYNVRTGHHRSTRR